MSYLSNELCGCPTACSSMEVINAFRAYQYSYISQVITDSRQYEWMGYISFPADKVYIRGDNYPIDCTTSDFYDTVSFFPYIQLDDNTCLYNTSYTNGFISLRSLSASQQITIYFDEDRRRQLCGICGCSDGCIMLTWIVGGVITAIVSLLLLFLLFKYRNQLRKICSKGTSIIVIKKET